MPTGTWIKGTLEDGVITVGDSIAHRQVLRTQKVAKYSIGMYRGSRRCRYLPKMVKASPLTGCRIPTRPQSGTAPSGDSIIQEKEQDIMLGTTRTRIPFLYGEQEAVYAKVDAKVVKIPKVPLRRGGAFL